jgi:hypothetical protein
MHDSSPGKSKDHSQLIGDNWTYGRGGWESL